MKHIKRRDFVGLCGAGVVSGVMLKGVRSDGTEVREKPAESSARTTFVSDREDGRFVDTAGFMQASRYRESVSAYS